MYAHVYMCMYLFVGPFLWFVLFCLLQVYTHAGFSVVLMKDIDHEPSTVILNLQSDARHARGEATRFVTASCT